MKVFEGKFKESMESQVPLLDRIARFIVKRRGKQMRPMFVFLSAKVSGEFAEKTYTAAALVELLHTATLVHDDVVDDSDRRRGFFSLKALWQSKVAVLIGDYLLSRGLLLSLKNKDYDLLEISSDSVRRMSEGELLQIEKARKLDITEDLYFEIISNKTASLIAACCALGAASTGADSSVIEKMRTIGENIGIAFQIKDDLLDIDLSETGKPKSIDIKEKKMTLPLIYTLSKVDRSMKRRIINTVKNNSTDNAKVADIIQLISEEGGVDYAKEKMHYYKNQALQCLATFGENEYTQAMADLVNFTVDRKS
jgi:octaprenyl-diphosphate synthase